MIIQTERLELIPLNSHQLGLWIEDIHALEKELNCAYKAEPMEGFFLEIVKGQYEITRNDPDNYIWHSFFFLVRKSDRVVVGSADFKSIPDENGEVEIGYGLGKEFEHNGYMSEAVNGMCEWVLRQNGVLSVVAETDLDGFASQRILERCGFKKFKEEDTLWWRLRAYQADIDEILSRRHDNGGDYWATTDRRLMKGSPFTTLDCALMLKELGMDPSESLLKETADLILSTWRDDGRFKISPQGAIYPCHTIHAARTLCHLGYASDPRLKMTFDHLLEIQHSDGGWRCNKFSFGRGPETEFSNPGPTLTALDAFRFSDFLNTNEALDQAVAFLLDHWETRIPLGPCHYGMGTLFMQVTYPFSNYNLFFYVYVLSFYDKAKRDKRFLEALGVLESKLINGKIIVERPNQKLAGFRFCKKGETSELATERYYEILRNIGRTHKFLYSGKAENPPVFNPEELYIATEKDKQELESLDFFENGEVERFIKDSSIYIYRIKDEYVACGTFLYPNWREDIPDGEKDRYRDIGMHVSEKHRGKGYGRSMVQNLTAIAICKGFIPITECTLKNKNSRTTLESAGYILI